MATKTRLTTAGSTRSSVGRLLAGLLLATTAVPAAADLASVLNQRCATGSQAVPVVLIHGTFASTRRAFSSLAPALHGDGHCLFALNYGRRGPLGPNGIDDVSRSAAQVREFVQQVLERTGAARVSLVGHSQGGLLAFMVANEPALAGRVARLVAVAPSINGTDRVPADLALPHCPACMQQGRQSAFIQALQRQQRNPEGVQSLIVATANDRVVTPVGAQFLQEPGVRNLLLQDLHPGLRASHSGVMHTPELIAVVRDFLAPEAGMNTERAPITATATATAQPGSGQE